VRIRISQAWTARATGMVTPVETGCQNPDPASLRPAAAWAGRRLVASQQQARDATYVPASVQVSIYP